MPSHYELILRVVMGTVFGAVIGFERDIHGRPVGLRTHAIVGMAAATFMVVSSQFLFFQNYSSLAHLPDIDTSRIAASVVSGIGFLAGGTILRSGLTIQGLTTAAGLWMVTAIGLCAGAGMYVEGSAVTALGLLVLTGFRRFENKDDHLIKRRVTLHLRDEKEVVSRTMQKIGELGAVSSHFDYEHHVEEKRVMVSFVVRFPEEVGTKQFISSLEALSEVSRIQVEHTH